MSLSSILILLTAVLGLYQNPSLATNTQLKAQVDGMAAQVIAMATQAMALPASTPLGVTPTSTFSISTPTSTETSSTTPIVIQVNPPAQQPSAPAVQPSQPLPVANPAGIIKVKAPNPPYSLGVYVHTSATSTEITANFSSQLGETMGAIPTLTQANLIIGSTTYPMKISRTSADLILDNDVIGQAGNIYQDNVHVETSNYYMDNVAQITIPRNVVLSLSYPHLGSGGKSDNKTFSTLTFTNNATGSVSLDKISLRWGSNGIVYGSSSFTGTLRLIDPKGNDVQATMSSSSDQRGGSMDTTWVFGNGLAIPANSSYILTLTGNDKMIPDVLGYTESLSAEFVNPNYITYTDNAGNSGLPLFTESMMPVEVADIMY